MLLWPALHALGTGQWNLDCRRDYVADDTDMVRLVQFLALSLLSVGPSHAHLQATRGYPLDKPPLSMLYL